MKPCSVSETVASISDIESGVVLHTHDHTAQALVVGRPIVDDTLGGVWVPSLVFDLRTNQRIIESESCIHIGDSDKKPCKWHIAESYTLGMDVPMPPPSIRTTYCLARRRLLGPGRLCPCGCGAIGTTLCACDWCDGIGESCGEYVGRLDDLCSACLDHGECGCACQCDNQVRVGGELCSFCEESAICDNCESDHDVNFDALCSSCQYALEEQRQEERLEEERLEEERLEKERQEALDEAAEQVTAS